MACLFEERVRVVAVIHALKAFGVRVKNWKNFLNGDLIPGRTSTQEDQLKDFAFGRELQLLPQQQITEIGGVVPQFMVEACEYLSKHLHTEGLFRKTGSLPRIRALRADLEKGQPIFSVPQSAVLQPCDVATLLKQFLRELPSPLIPTELQGPLCQAQGLEIAGDHEGGRDRATLLLTVLFPPANARALKYLCVLLRQAAQRCSENRMEVRSLALVIAPNLLQCPANSSKLTVGTEKQLDRQAAVVKALITHADQIGVLPSFIVETLARARTSESTPPADGSTFSKRAGLSVYRSLRRQRRRSVGEIFVDAFTKLKTGRTPAATLNVSDATSACSNSKSPTPQSPITVKRKASEGEGSARKRRSLHDLREKQCSGDRCLDGSTGSQNPQAEKSGIEETHVLSSSSTKRSHQSDNRRLQRGTAKDDKTHHRKRSLRFFNMSSGSSSSVINTGCQHNDPDNGLSDCKTLSDDAVESSNSKAHTHAWIPVILIDGPRQAIVGTEVDDDPDLLNFSFVENLPDCLHLELESSPDPVQESSKPFEDSCTIDNATEIESKSKLKQMTNPEETQSKGTGVLDNMEPEKDLPYIETTQKVRRKYRPPRRSISMPEVALEQSLCQEITTVDLREVAVSLIDDAWQVSENVVVTKDQDEENKTPENKCMVNDDGQGNHEMLNLCKANRKAESGFSSKKTYHRTSVTERLKSFNALTALLRMSRSPPKFWVPHRGGSQLGVARLRRQGARRFGRSISHDGVPESLPEQNPLEHQRELPESSYPRYTSPNSALDHKLDLTQNQPDSKKEQNDEVSPYSPQRPNTLPPASTDESQSLNHELTTTSSELVILKSIFSDHLEESKFQVEEFELHEQMIKQCRIGSPLHEHDQNVDVSVHSPFPHQDNECCDVSSLVTGDSPLDHLTNIMQLAVSTASQISPAPTHMDLQKEQKASPTYQLGSCQNVSPLSLKELVDDQGSVTNRLARSLDFSPPAFHFRSSSSRRLYRDSPRWHSSDVRVASWNSLQL